MKKKKPISKEPPAPFIYLLRESAVTRRRSSIEAEGEEGKIPKSIRHCTPLRSPKRLDTSNEDVISGNVLVVSIAAGDIPVNFFLLLL
jgi:hypothetical protein